MQISQAWVGLSCINYLYPQPASTPQVSRMVGGLKHTSVFKSTSHFNLNFKTLNSCKSDRQHSDEKKIVLN